MQTDRVQVLVQQAAAGNVEAFVTLVQEFAPTLRLALGAHLDQPSAIIAVEFAVWSAARHRLGEWLPDTPFAQWLQQMAVEPVTTHLMQADRQAIEIQDALSHQFIEQCRDALADGSELSVSELPARLAGLPDAARTLLQHRYRERQRPAALAASLMISEAELATTLASARAACDWRDIATAPGPGDRLLPSLIEDWLNGTIDADSRALLATNLGRDPERAAQFARQVRIHLALSAVFAPFTSDDALAITRQTGLGAGDSGRVMMGDSPRAPGTPRPSTSDRRPARTTISNHLVVPVEVDVRRSSPLPWIIGGVMVALGLAAMVLSSTTGAASRLVQPTTITPPTTPSPTSSIPSAPSTAQPRAQAGVGGVLRPLPVAPAEPRVLLLGVTADVPVYCGQPLELRALISSMPTVTEVEYWVADQRLGSARGVPFSLKWTPSRAGAVVVQARAMSGSVVKASSQSLSLTVTTAYGSGQLTREWWNGLPGDRLAGGLAALTSSTAPSGRTLESQFASPQHWNDSYLQRLSGYLIPPLDGEYIFWISADDEAELWLSTDESREQRRRIAGSPCVTVQEWQRDDGQRSGAIRLRAGQRYYIEALHKEGGGDDHVMIGWQLPNGTLERPIPGAHLTPAPPGATPTGPAMTPAVAAPAGTPAIVSATIPPSTPSTVPPTAAMVAAVGETVVVLWDGETKAGGSGYASSGIAKVTGSGRAGGIGLQSVLGTDFINLGWNWLGWFPDDGGSDVRSANALAFWLRFEGDNRPTRASVQFLCGPKNIQARSATIDIAALVPSFADGQWHQVVIPFARLTAPGFDLAKVWEFKLTCQGKGALVATVSIDDVAALRLPASAPAATNLEAARRPDLMIWDGEGANGGAGFKGSGNGGQSPLDNAPGQGHNGAGLRARLGGGNVANVGWNWYAWSGDNAGTDLNGFAALTMWVRFSGPAVPQQVVMRLTCSPREPFRRTVDVNLTARQPGLLDGAWHQVIVPFVDLIPQGQDFDRAKVWEVSFDLSSTATMEGSFDVDEIGALRSLIAPAPAAVAPWKVVRAINLGGESTEVDGMRFLGHRSAETEGASPVGSHRPGPWLSDLTWIRGTTGNNEIHRDRSADNRPLTIDGKVYAKGLGVHANSEVVYALDGRQSGFTAVVGVDDEAQSGEVIFQVWLDGQKVWDSGVLRKGAAKAVAVPLIGRKELRLVVDANGSQDWDHADWANAQFLVPGGDDGALQVQSGRRTTVAIAPKPPVDPRMRALLGTAVIAAKEGLAFRVKVPNGPSRVWLWIAENGAANSRQFDLTVEGVTLAGVGSLPANGWEKLGPVELTVADGAIDITATAIKGTPQVMGIVVEQPAQTP